jgi:hypothetical protein
MAIARCSETLASKTQSTGRINPKERHQKIRRRENLKSRKLLNFPTTSLSLILNLPSSFLLSSLSLFLCFLSSVNFLNSLF